MVSAASTGSGDAGLDRGRVLTETRAGDVLLLVLALANGLFLYLAPGSAQEHYAWPLAPPASAAFLGAGYLAGVVATALVLAVAQTWREFRMLAPALFVLAVGLLVATLMHADRFRWDYPPTWLWTVVYAGVPVGLAWLWRRQEAVASPAVAADPALRGVRIASALLGCVLGAVAVALMVAPASTGDMWPWELTPLTARSIGSWYALVATALITCSVTVRQRREVVIPYVTLGTWSLLLLALALVHRGDMVGDTTDLLIWLIGTALLLLLSLAALTAARRPATGGTPTVGHAA